MECFTSSDISLIKIMKSIGPITEPCGISLITFCHFDLTPSKHTHWVLPQRNDLIHFSRSPFIPTLSLSSLHLSCAIESYSFAQERTRVGRQLAILASLNLLVDGCYKCFHPTFMCSFLPSRIVKKLFRVSALSFGVIALEPSALVRDGIDCLVFSLDLAYFQNNLGLLFTLNAKFLKITP